MHGQSFPWANRRASTAVRGKLCSSIPSRSSSQCSSSALKVTRLLPVGRSSAYTSANWFCSSQEHWNFSCFFPTCRAGKENFRSGRKWFFSKPSFTSRATFRGSTLQWPHAPPTVPAAMPFVPVSHSQNSPMSSFAIVEKFRAAISGCSDSPAKPADNRQRKKRGGGGGSRSVNKGKRWVCPGRESLSTSVSSTNLGSIPGNRRNSVETHLRPDEKSENHFREWQAARKALLRRAIETQSSAIVSLQIQMRRESADPSRAYASTLCWRTTSKIICLSFIKSNGKKRTKTNQYIASFLCF